MSAEALTEFVKLLANFQPGWVLAIAVSCILAWRLPEVLKAIRSRRR